MFALGKDAPRRDTLDVRFRDRPPALVAPDLGRLLATVKELSRALWFQTIYALLRPNIRVADRA